ncbi:hypothetical protein [Desulfoscipio geothermicus]|uniref:Uncharacterized protein n=1 Tax=Desulfoscipio geothermicus DSM 3669 TaxID=1121426 RepID=A0A1I6CP51_9FIRM|nr:hypothetical protein [Desulfoscipio geothermicus]SFQ94937.1 hypothetical protein SAMN05660706_10188 [Desulfoscipio geothermicus DSM 3669]
MKKKDRYVLGQAFLGVAVFLLIYTYFFHSKFQPVSGTVGDWGTALMLSTTAVLAGMLIELGRFWGWVIEVKIDADLLVMQGIPAAVLSLVPGPFWLQYGGKTYPYIFFADPVVTGIAGVWLGVILFRSMFNNKKIKEEMEDKNQ